MRPSPMGEGVSGGRGQSPCPPVLDVTPFPVGNNSMPPVASPRLGTSGCDYPSRIEFDKKRANELEIPQFLRQENRRALENKG